MNELEHLNERIALLERRVRRATRFALSVLLAGGALVIVGQAAPEAAKSDGKRVIEAEEFVVRDTKGNPRIRIGMQGESAFITMQRCDSSAAVDLRVADAHYSSIDVTAENGTHASLTAGHDDAQVTLSRAKTPMTLEDRLRSALKGGKLDDNFTRDLAVWDSLSLSLHEDMVGIMLYKAGKKRGQWFATDTLTNFHLNDMDGKLRGFWGTDKGLTCLSINDVQERTRLVLGTIDVRKVQAGSLERRSESSLILNGEDGKVIFSAP